MDMTIFHQHCQSVLNNSWCLNRLPTKTRIARRTLEGAGLYQATTYSLTSAEKAAQFALEKRESIRLAMPMSEERSRTSFEHYSAIIRSSEI